MEQISIAIFFLFFAFSFARTPLTQQENDITNIKLPGTLLDTDATSTNQFDKETQHVQENQDHLPEPRGKKIKALPLTFVRLHPFDRHFRVRSRRPSLSCHHHHHHFHHADNLKPRTQSAYLDVQIPYGNDMIPDDDDFDHVFPGGLSQVPQEWMSFLHHNNDDDDDDDEQKMSRFIIKRNNHDKFGKMKLKGRLYDPFDDEQEDEDGKISAMQHEDHHRHGFEKKKMKKHLHRHHEEEEQEDEEGNEAHKEEKKTGGFVRHIRKFLGNYFD